MTNKKLWLSLLAVVLIVCMLSVCLVSCKKNEEPEKKKTTPTKSTELQAIEAIIGGVKKSVEDGDMTDLVVGGALDLTINETKYTLALDLDLDLLQYKGWEDYEKAATYNAKDTYYELKDGSYNKVSIKESEFVANKYYTRDKKDVEKTSKSNTYLNAELSKNDDVILGMYYYDTDEEMDIDGTDANTFYQGNSLYVQYKEKDATSTTKMRFPAPFINGTMAKLGASVDFSGIDLGDESVWGSLDTYLGIVAGLAEDGKVSDTEASITLNIGTLLDSSNPNNLLALVGGIQGYFDNLDLDIDAEQLGEVLPKISLTLSASLENGKATGFAISLSIKEKDIVIKNKSNAHTLIDIEMSKDVNIGLALDYTVGDADTTYVDAPTSFTGYKTYKNLVDLDVSVDLYLAADVSMSLGSVNIAIPGGYYTLKLDAAINPYALIEPLTSGGLSFDSPADIVSAIKTLVGCVSGLQLNLQRTAKADGTEVSEVPTINLVISERYNGTTKQLESGKYATISTTILGSDNISVGGVALDSAINTVETVLKKAIEKDDEEAPSVEEEDSTTKTLKLVAKYLLGAYIGINDGKTGHGKIFASFNTANTDPSLKGVIPFSGYTEWTGSEKNSAFKYYKVGTAEAYTPTEDTAPVAGKKYYVSVGGYYRDIVTEGEGAEAFNNYRKYYTKSGNVYSPAGDISSFASATQYAVYVKQAYREVSVTSFDTSETYYEYTEATYTEVPFADVDLSSDTKYYVKGIDSEGDFGLGLNAQIVVDDNIAIDATLTNLDIFGLPNVLTARISNIKINLWDGDYPVHLNSNVTTYKEVFPD